MAWTPHSLGRISATVITLPFVGHPPTDVSLDYTVLTILDYKVYTIFIVFLPTLLLFLLFIFNCGLFLLVFRSFSSIVALRIVVMLLCLWEEMS